jgi:uncharacterized integral membrane protein
VDARHEAGHDEDSVMFRKILTGIVVVPLAILIIVFAVANRQSVTVSFDPFSTAHPAYSATAPLFVLIFIVLILGVVVGGIAAWLRQGKWRRIARKLDADVRAVRGELETIRHRFGTETPPPAPEPKPTPAIPPPVP